LSLSCVLKKQNFQKSTWEVAQPLPPASAKSDGPLRYALGKVRRDRAKPVWRKRDTGARAARRLFYDRRAGSARSASRAFVLAAALAPAGRARSASRAFVLASRACVGE